MQPNTPPKRKWVLGSFAGLTISALPSTVPASAGLWLFLSFGAWWLFDQPVWLAPVMGFFGVVLHWLAELLHQVGHYLAGLAVGYPMNGLTAFGLVSSGRYPADEPKLPGRTHLIRALGGPLFSLFIGGCATLLLFSWQPQNLFVAGLLAWFQWENILVFGLTAFFPAGLFVKGIELDGDTILRYLRGEFN